VASPARFGCRLLINGWRSILEIVWFTLVAIMLYLVSDWILDRIEIARGERLAKRNIVFFVIIGSLSLIVFQIAQLTLSE
jgi:hypothetical protein